MAHDLCLPELFVFGSWHRAPSRDPSYAGEVQSEGSSVLDAEPAPGGLLKALLLPRGFQPTPGKISDAVTRVIDLLYGETATGSAADVLAERHLPVAARRFPRAYPLEPGLWRNLLDDDRAFA